jgi:hypothetical protein
LENLALRHQLAVLKRRDPRPRLRKAFLDNHLSRLVSIDFFTVPTGTSRGLHPTRVPRSCDRAGREASAKNPEKLFRLLSVPSRHGKTAWFDTVKLGGSLKKLVDTAVLQEFEALKKAAVVKKYL